MSKYVCLRCFNIYDGSTLREGVRSCPRTECHSGTYFGEIDEMIIPTIIELNKKNYRTVFCCAGHYGTRDEANRMYILFDVGIVLPHIPDNFEVEDKYYTTIHKGRVIEDTNKIQKVLRVKDSKTRNRIPIDSDILFKLHIELLEWAKSLPINKQQSRGTIASQQIYDELKENENE
jgi:hypothetical protein